MPKNKTFDIFISYKRKSLPTANNLYYRLTNRGYSTFYDLEEMGSDDFNVQLLNYIENAQDVFVILEEGSLDACKEEDWDKDWFCHEIAFALEKKKNIIPLLLGNYQMPPESFFPDKLKDLSFKNAPEFRYSYFEEYIDKLIKRNYLLSKPGSNIKATSVFKFYSNENCQVFKEGKMVCSLEGLSDMPYYLPVPRKGDYRFQAVNESTGESKIIDEKIDAGEEKQVNVVWKRKPKWPKITMILCLLVFLISLFLFFVIRDCQDKPTVPLEPNDTICVAVDLGLSSGTLWGDRNVGAKKSYDFGNYYSWGEVIPIEEKAEEHDDNKIVPSNISGTSHDVASIRQGPRWELPTKEQLEELKSECTWEWVSKDRHNGYEITGPNGNKLFIPAAGCIFKIDGHKYYDQFGYYWTGDHNVNDNSEAFLLLFGIDRINVECGKKYLGRSVRAVCSNDSVR